MPGGLRSLSGESQGISRYINEGISTIIKVYQGNVLCILEIRIILNLRPYERYESSWGTSSDASNW